MFADTDPREHPAVQLTGRQQQIADVVNAHVERHGYPPTVREIGQAVGLTSSSTVHAHLANLERLGVIRRDPTKPRALAVVGRERERAAARPPAGVRVLPLLGQIAAGSPILADENVEDMLAVPESLTASGENFILRVRGDSMVDDGILDGDFVIVRRQDDAVDGEIVAALVGGDEATVKRIYREAGRVRLQPANESMQPILLDAGEVAVAGKVVGVFRRL
jgi:repressor LexA